MVELLRIFGIFGVYQRGGELGSCGAWRDGG